MHHIRVAHRVKLYIKKRKKILRYFEILYIKIAYVFSCKKYKSNVISRNVYKLLKNINIYIKNIDTCRKNYWIKIKATRGSYRKGMDLSAFVY